MYFSGVLGDQSLIEIDRSLAGIMVFDGDGTSSLNDDIYILGDLDNEEGLTGQVILNADATTDEGWGDGRLVFGPDEDEDQFWLSPTPYYDNPSSGFGGGAVGRVPYYCHYADCSPVGHKVDEDMDTGLDGLGESENGYQVIKKVTQGGQWDSVTIVHYGSIEQVGAGAPFTVRRKSIGSIGNWGSPLPGFTHTMHPGGNLRAIRIDGPFAPPFDYLIEPKTDGQQADYLRCAETTAPADVPVFDWDYRLRVVELQDISANGLLEPDDITAWIDDPTDTTLDGIADNADLIDVTEAVANSDDW
ncbi:MAG: hypothetical protein IPJ41_04090 [Phycisphaerales bacterium]|nr:hypothetical protein [Phycisphaerales bacterium]